MENLPGKISRKIRVLIADDHAAFREGLSRCLKDEEDIDVVGVSADGEETVTMAKELLPDVILIDVSMPKLNGVEAARQIKQDCPRTAIVMISAFDYQSYVVSSLRIGVAGYLLKTSPLSEIIAAIRLVNAGEGVFDLKVTGKILHSLKNSAGESQNSRDLNPREMQIMRLTAKGLSNKEIATGLAISERTVHTHLVNIFKKLGVGSRTEAVLHALKEGWITLEDLPDRNILEAQPKAENSYQNNLPDGTKQE